MFIQRYVGRWVEVWTLACFSVLASPGAWADPVGLGYTVKQIASPFINASAIAYRPLTHDLVVAAFQDPDGELPHVLYQVTPATGTVTVLTETGFFTSNSIAVGPTGNLYIEGPNLGAGGAINVYNNIGVYQKTITYPNMDPRAIAIDAKGNLYVPFRGESEGGIPNTIDELPADGSAPIVRVSGFSSDVFGLAIDPSGNLVLEDYNTVSVYQVTPDGETVLLTAFTGQSGGGPLAIDPITSDVLIFAGADTGSQSGTIFGLSELNPVPTAIATGATFTGITVDPDGNVYATERPETEGPPTNESVWEFSKGDKCPASGYTANVANYKQADYPDVYLDSSPYTIAEQGCYVSALGDISGHNPQDAEVRLNAVGAIGINGGINSAKKAARALGLSGDLPRVVFSTTALEEMMNSSTKTLILVEVQHGDSSHFVAITGEVFDSSSNSCRFTIADPGSSTTKFLDEYTDGALSIRGFLPGSGGSP